jgi:4-aminobutyrate aminotransferase / (S)-3-amino-2-methylpropionate transaminase / 5-aminovalerate transaminase
MDSLPMAAVGSTFGGHPVACAAALKMIEVLERDDLVARAARLGALLSARFQQFAERYPFVGDVRGAGAIYGMELVTDRAAKTPAPDLVAAISREAFGRGLLTMKAGLYGNVVRVLPALTISDAELEEGLDILDAAFAAVA